jgi:hypothetical protein
LEDGELMAQHRSSTKRQSASLTSLGSTRIASMLGGELATIPKPASEPAAHTSCRSFRIYEHYVDHAGLMASHASHAGVSKAGPRAGAAGPSEHVSS